MTRFVKNVRMQMYIKDIHSLHLKTIKMENSIPPIEWEINDVQDQYKSRIYILEKFLFVFIITIFLYPPLGFLMIVIVIIILVNLKQNTNLKKDGGMILEKYGINNNGITINDLRGNKKRSLSWNELDSFYSYAKTNPVIGLVVSKLAGDDFVVVNKSGKHLKLRANINSTLKVQKILSKKLRSRAPNQSQNILIPSLGSPFKMFQNSSKLSLPINKSNLYSSTNKTFTKRSQEKYLHEQRIVKKHNIEKERSKFKQNILIIAYLTISFILLIAYFISSKDLLY